MTETIEPVDLDIFNVQEKTARNKQKYWSYETNLGTMSVFDALVAEDLNSNVGKKVNVDVATVGNYKNIKAINKVLGTIPKEENTPDKNARLRRITDCVLAANQAFMAGTIKKEDVVVHAKALYGLIQEIDN